MNKTDSLIIALGQTGAGKKSSAIKYYGDQAITDLYNNNIIFIVSGIREKYIILTPYGEMMTKKSGVGFPIPAIVSENNIKVFDYYSQLTEEEQMSWENRNRIEKKFTDFFSDSSLWVPDGEYRDKDDRKIAVELPDSYVRHIAYKEDIQEAIGLYDDFVVV